MRVRASDSRRPARARPEATSLQAHLYHMMGVWLSGNHVAGIAQAKGCGFPAITHTSGSGKTSVSVTRAPGKPRPLLLLLTQARRCGLEQCMGALEVTVSKLPTPVSSCVCRRGHGRVQNANPMCEALGQSYMAVH